MTSPAWLGIGAQRSGTTWFVDLLTQHPAIELSALDRPAGSVAAKELHLLDRLDLPLDDLRRTYLDAFPDNGPTRGEFTPSYLRCPWAATRARELVSSDCMLIAIVRDPIARFESSMDLLAAQAEARGTPVNPAEQRLWQADAVWAGFYDHQLEAWQRSLPENPLLVIDYERLRAEPQAVLDRVWAELGLDTHRLVDIERASASTVERSYRCVDAEPGLFEALRDLYRPSVERVSERHGIDVTRWLSGDQPNR